MLLIKHLWFFLFRPPPAPVHVEDFVNHVAQLHRDSDYGFASEFAVLFQTLL